LITTWKAETAQLLNQVSNPNGDGFTFDECRKKDGEKLKEYRSKVAKLCLRERQMDAIIKKWPLIYFKENNDKKLGSAIKI